MRENYSKSERERYFQFELFVLVLAGVKDQRKITSNKTHHLTHPICIHHGLLIYHSLIEITEREYPQQSDTADGKCFRKFLR